MTYILTKELRGEIDFYTLYPSYRKILFELDQNRFRAFKEDQIEKIIRLILEQSQRVNLQFGADIAILMEVMLSHGSYFLDDSRYKFALPILMEKPTGVDRRMNKFRSKISDYKDSIYGKHGEILLGSMDHVLSQFAPTDIMRVNAIEFTLHLLRQSFKRSPKYDEYINAYELSQAAEYASRALKLPPKSGGAVCVLLSFYLGNGFYKDPLFPWVHDVMTEKEWSDARAEELLNYALKRLKAMAKLIKSARPEEIS